MNRSVVSRHVHGCLVPNSILCLPQGRRGLVLGVEVDSPTNTSVRQLASPIVTVN